MRMLVPGAVALTLLCGCDGAVGEGELPVDFYIQTPNGAESFGVSECSAATVQGVLVFDGSSGRTLGDYTRRASWSSDAPDIVSIDPSGQLLAKAPGIATISAKYLEFTASASVVVIPIQELYITPTLSDIATNIDQQFYLYGVFSSSPEPVNLTTSAEWDLNGEDVRAYVTSAGMVHGGAAAAGAPVELFARLPACDRSASTQFQVSSLLGLRLEYEFPPPENLPVGASESVRVWGVFGDASHTEQNLSNQVEVRYDSGTALIPATGTESIILQAYEMTSAASLTFGLYDFAMSVRTQPMNIVQDALLDVDVQPDNLVVRYPDTGQLQAIGTFRSGLSIPITRHVTWTSGDPSVLQFESTLYDAGKIYVEDLSQSVQVQAYSASAEGNATAYAQVLIFAD